MGWSRTTDRVHVTRTGGADPKRAVPNAMKCVSDVSGGLNPRKSGGGKRWRNLVAPFGVHFWWRVLVAVFGAESANSKGPVRGPCC